MDNKYLNGKIYKITSSQTDKIYIGSTIRTLHKRLQCHRYDFKQSSNVSSREILKHDDATIELIEEYPCNSKKELEKKERLYIVNTPNTVNKIIPTRTQKEHYQDNIDELRLICKKYRKNNPEIMKLSNKKWKENNTDKIKIYTKNYYIKNSEKEKIRTKKYYENNRDKLKAIRDFQNTWCGNYNNNNHNNLLRISLDIFK